MKIARPLLLTAVCACLTHGALAAESREVMVERVGADIEYFASDALEGRGVETRGIHLAAERILAEYKKHGLKPGMPDGTFKQTFEVNPETAAINDATEAVLKHVDGRETKLKITSEYQPLQRGANGTASGELYFIGYGISSEGDNYDEYAGHDVEGKILVMIRREPQQDVKGGAFQGTNTSTHAYIDRKLQLAVQHKAAGVIFVNDAVTTKRSERDDLSPPHGFGSASAGVPFIHIKQSVLDELLKANPLQVPQVDGEDEAAVKIESLQAACEYIDKTLTPLSQPMTGWSADVTTKFDTKSVAAHNLIGVLEGEGDLADETIVVGAHYDHIGYGGRGSKTPKRNGEIHNGADDNATGTAAVLEIVRRMTSGPKPKRRIVFICFSGEERGLLGSKHYVKSPVFPLEKTVAMLNYDMIGTLRNNVVTVNGVDTAVEFRAIAEAADDKSPLDTKMVAHPFAGSDHLPFFQKQIPVMFCFTGLTDWYHTPDDDFERINVEGVVAVTDYTETLLRSIDALPKAPEFQAVNRRSQRKKLPYMGIVPNLTADGDQPGVPIQSVRQDGPAKASGLQVGDAIIKVNDTDIDSYGDLLKVLGGAQQNDELTILVQRGKEQVELKLKLAAPR
ncbi:M20/M25/M40 family metallo-hydrolase [Fuerstiella marisgermanici]|uniref:Arginyl aminopeptidase n=1 Tax=Fuerstiella marisgermanici TaxID=1891926 RepID=A0A1P8WA92_9PLAN|nr:M20/M25/M40 family metallo-hydrolase [Fuerstiella marisgermanici]APZ90976.1 Arginyl aminopeptidase [Fuerstiella marisgermanici]